MRPLRETLSSKSLSLIGIPKRFHEYSLNDFNADTEGLITVKGFVQNYISKMPDILSIPINGILFYGSNGVGKTMLSSIILKEAYRHRYTCRRCTFLEYISKYTASWNSEPQEKEELEDDFFENYKNAEFLVLEEVGKEVETKIAPSILEDLLRYREEKNYPIIICTNLPPSKLSEKYGASINSLLMGNCVPIKIESDDIRGYKEV